MGRLLSLAFAKNTHRVYMSGWHAFCRFKAHQASAVSTVSPQDIAGFISWLSLHHYSPSTINYVAGVGCFCKLRGWADPTDNFIVAKLLEGCRRDGAMQDGRLPISLSLLCRLLEALPKVCASQFESTMFRAAMLSALFGFLRVGEFTANSTNHMQECVCICKNVCFCGNQSCMSVVLALRHAKTSQVGPPQWVNIARLQDVAICPVTALQGYLQARKQLSGPLFCHERGDPLTWYQFTAVRRAALSFCGVAGDHYRSHSFRMGVASTAFALGVPVADIKRSGRWRSEAFRRYIRIFPQGGSSGF